MSCKVGKVKGMKGGIRVETSCGERHLLSRDVLLS